MFSSLLLTVNKWVWMSDWLCENLTMMCLSSVVILIHESQCLVVLLHCHIFNVTKAPEVTTTPLVVLASCKTFKGSILLNFSLSGSATCASEIHCLAQLFHKKGFGGFFLQILDMGEYVPIFIWSNDSALWPVKQPLHLVVWIEIFCALMCG